MLNRLKMLTRLTAMILVVPMSLGMLMTTSLPANAEDNPVVVMETSLGDIVIELYPDKAPETVDNFLGYVNSKFYDGLIFHRVISNFMIQGGGFTKDMVKKKGNPPIKNEATNGLSNTRGTIAMARTGEVNSATSQFFINVKDNPALDHKGTDPRSFGYCVFGTVIDGMDVVDEIRNVKTVSKSGYNDVPANPIVIMKAYERKGDEKKKMDKKEG